MTFNFHHKQKNTKIFWGQYVHPAGFV